MENPRKVKLFGDRQEALRKYGQGQALLRATKAISELLGIPYYRLFSADKSVIAQSISGMQDQITLSHKPEVPIEEEEEKKPYCSITLVDIPESIPPMKWYALGLETFTKVDNVWIIKDPDGVVEVEGIDYIKTYYRLNVIDCNACQPIDFTLGKEMGAITASTPYRPFWYRSERDDGSLIYTYQGGMVPHYMGNEDSVPPILPDPMNHMIYSYWASGQAEIIQAGSDAGGNYILWKAYTEWSNVGPSVVDFTRTGLGYMLMQGFIKNQGVNLCESVGNIIKVDCCLKPAEDRPVSIHWEKCIISEWCAAPDSAPMSTLAYFQIWSWILMNLKANGDGCLPYEWSLAGMGEIVPAWGDKKLVTYKVPAWEFYSRDCHATLLIKGEDRCGTSDSIFFKSCCDSNPSPVSIGYTSLLMSCGAQQTFTAGGGCGPYSWAVTGGGGTITQGGVYTAPATNPNCISNPTITLTDCCGNTVQIQLAVNCYSAAGDAICHDTSETCAACHVVGGLWYGGRLQYRWRYNCDGTLTNYWYTVGCNDTYLPCCPGMAPGDPCCTPGGQPCGNFACMGTHDMRTVAMKNAGCCPINPYTGLPF